MGRERSYDGVRAGSDSTIEIDFRYAGRRCKERIKLQPTPANLKKAAQHRAAILLAIENGTFDYATTFPNSKKAKVFSAPTPLAPATMTVADYLDRWAKEMEKKTKASTMEGYTKIIKNLLIPKLGHIPLPDLRRPAIKEMLVAKKCGNKRLKNIQSVLRTALDEAVADELLETNVMKDWTYENAAPPKTKDDVDPFTPEEQEAILAVAEGQIKNLIQFMLWSGLRTSEMVALTWDDIDWRRGVVIINKAWTEASDEPEAPKTDSGYREVKLLGPAREALQAQKAHTLIKGIEVFQDPRYAEPWAGDQAIRQCFWKQLLVRAKVRYRRPYQTRHTYASMMLSAGENPMWVAKQMGHSNWTMIGRIYGRWMPDAEPNAGGKAELTFGATPNNKKENAGAI